LPDNEDVQGIYEKILSLTSEFFYTIEVDPDGKLSGEKIMGALERVTGFSQEELNLKGGPEGVIYPADFSVFKGLFKSVLDGEEKVVEYRIVAKDGQTRLLQDHARPEMDPGGNVVRIIGVVRDISGAKQPEQTSSSTSEEYYRMLFDAAGDAISIVEPDTEIVLDVNPKACEMYGFTRDEFIGMSFVTLTKQKVRGQKEIKRFIKTGTTELYYTVHYTKDGREIHLEISGSLVEFDGKKALMSIHRDVTGRDFS
jgi:PAS domain S-box-containing protein